MFPNERKESEKHPDFTGQGLVAGVEMWVSMWVKRSKKTGEEFFSISLRPKDEARREGAQRQEQARVSEVYHEEGYDDRAPPPRYVPQQERVQGSPSRGPSRFEKYSRPTPPPEDEQFIPEFGEQWEREP